MVSETARVGVTVATDADAGRGPGAHKPRSTEKAQAVRKGFMPSGMEKATVVASARQRLAEFERGAAPLAVPGPDGGAPGARAVSALRRSSTATAAMLQPAPAAGHPTANQARRGTRVRRGSLTGDVVLPAGGAGAAAPVTVPRRRSSVTTVVDAAKAQAREDVVRRVLAYVSEDSRRLYSPSASGGGEFVISLRSLLARDAVAAGRPGEGACGARARASLPCPALRCPAAHCVFVAPTTPSHALLACVFLLRAFCSPLGTAYCFSPLFVCDAVWMLDAGCTVTPRRPPQTPTRAAL